MNVETAERQANSALVGLSEAEKTAALVWLHRLTIHRRDSFVEFEDEEPLREVSATRRPSPEIKAAMEAIRQRAIKRRNDPNLRHIANENDLAIMAEHVALMMPAQFMAMGESEEYEPREF